jgi:hypothetical protein
MEMALVVRVYTGRLSRTRTISIDTMLVIELLCPITAIKATIVVNFILLPYFALGLTKILWYLDRLPRGSNWFTR